MSVQKARIPKNNSILNVKNNIRPKGVRYDQIFTGTTVSSSNTSGFLSRTTHQNMHTLVMKRLIGSAKYIVNFLNNSMYGYGIWYTYFDNKIVPTKKPKKLPHVTTDNNKHKARIFDSSCLTRAF
jgi:hypothetical protein